MSREQNPPGEVVRLPTAQPLPEPVPPSAPRGLHAVATTAMASFAIVGIFLSVALITVNWTEEARRIVIVVLVLTTVAFMASAMVAVFAGARATHPRHKDGDPSD